jgi:hypothetical protein
MGVRIMLIYDLGRNIVYLDKRYCVFGWEFVISDGFWTGRGLREWVFSYLGGLMDARDGWVEEFNSIP